MFAIKKEILREFAEDDEPSLTRFIVKKSKRKKIRLYKGNHINLSEEELDLSHKDLSSTRSAIVLLDDAILASTNLAQTEIRNTSMDKADINFVVDINPVKLAMANWEELFCDKDPNAKRAYELAMDTRQVLKSYRKKSRRKIKRNKKKFKDRKKSADTNSANTPNTNTSNSSYEDIFINNVFLGCLKELRPQLAPRSPSIFLVYAHKHKNPMEPKADQEVAKYIISLFHDILGLKLYSDITAKNSRTQKDILLAQLSLLPNYKDSHVESVDKVILCGSEMLASQMKTDTYKRYEQHINDTCANACKYKLDLLNHLDENLNDFIDKHPDEEIHHLMTELAFLKRRIIKDRSNDNTIIPVLLNGCRQNALPNYITNWDVYIGEARWRDPGEWNGIQTFKNQGIHLSIFKLLERLFSDSNCLDVITHYREDYDRVIRLLREGSIPNDTLKQHALSAIQKKEEMQRENIEISCRLAQEGSSIEFNCSRAQASYTISPAITMKSNEIISLAAHSNDTLVDDSDKFDHDTSFSQS